MMGKSSFSLTVAAALVAAAIVLRTFIKDFFATVDVPKEVKDRGAAVDASKDSIAVDDLRRAALAALDGVGDSLPLSPLEIRRFLSRVRCAHVGRAADEDVLRFPVSHDSERAVHAAIADVAAGTKDARLQQLGSCAQIVLNGASSCSSAVEMAILVHRAAHHCYNPSLGGTVAELEAPALSPLVEQREVDGERGLYARVTLPAGSVVLTERPHIVHSEDDDVAGTMAALVLARKLLNHQTGLRPAPGAPRDGGDDAKAAAMWLREMKGVSESDVMAAHAAVVNNAFQTRIEGLLDPIGLIYERVSMLNHSCWPNCTLTPVDAASGRARVYTLEEVPAGAQLTICYQDELATLPRSERRACLATLFGFECGCSRCNQPASACALKELDPVDQLLDDLGGLGGDMNLARRAHASVFSVQKLRGKIAGFKPKQYDSWEDARSAAEGALGILQREVAATHWIAVQTRALRCQALEALAGEERAAPALIALAVRALAEHAETLMQLLPAHCTSLISLATRLAGLDARLRGHGAVGEAMLASVRRRSQGTCKTMDALHKQKATVDGWLSGHF